MLTAEAYLDYWFDFYSNEFWEGKVNPNDINCLRRKYFTTEEFEGSYLEDEKNGHMLVLLKGVTYADLINRMSQKYFVCNGLIRLDELETRYNDRHPHLDGSYCIWTRHKAYRHKELVNMYPSEAKWKGLLFMTLLEYLLFYDLHYHLTNEYSDTIGSTLCVGKTLSENPRNYFFAGRRGSELVLSSKYIQHSLNSFFSMRMMWKALYLN